nr:MAG TPA: hypothetical protein [Caudoviricetes sp.]
MLYLFLVVDVMGYILSEPIMPIDVMGSRKTLGVTH